ncbi:MAG: type IV secretion system DNA-binding domain-containing protein [Patescibacteria group bacterium]|nr:type IV secretion system DNA-binding domain-containing protein [Patescibacteria group bacterium]
MPIYNHDHENEVTYFAATNFRNQMKKFGIKTDDRRRHMYVLGKTGSGKTTLLANMALQDIERGHGVAITDPHGDVLNSLLDFIPSNRVNDVVYFNPSDTEHPIAFNVLENVNPDHKHLVASGLMSVFKKIWANLWSARMEYILNNTILALLDSPGNTLLGIMRMLSDKDFRRKIVDNINDPVVKSFWINEYANYSDKFRQEAIAPIQNKVGQFLSSSIIRNIVGQPKSTIDPRKIIDEGKILLLDLSKGKIGEDNSALLGAMMVTKLWLAAMSRVDIPEKERLDFYLYVDEFQNFATESFADILSEARKYHLNLLIAHQYINQLISPDSKKVKEAVFGNVGTLVCFRVGAADAEELVTEFEPTFEENDLVNIGKHEIFLKLMINGMATSPFTAKTLPPLSQGKENDNRDKIIAVSRERYSNPRAEVEERIVRWSGMEKMFKGTAEEEYIDEEELVFKEGKVKKEKPSGPSFKAYCDNCGATTAINFIPDLSKAIFCKNCLPEFKRGAIDPRKLKSKNPHLKAEIEKYQKSLVTANSEEGREKSEPASSVSKPETGNQKTEIGNQKPVVAISEERIEKSEKKIEIKKKEITPEPAPKKTAKANFMADKREEAEGVSLANLKDDNRVVGFNNRRGGTGKSVKPGEVVRIKE